MSFAKNIRKLLIDVLVIIIAIESASFGLHGSSLEVQAAELPSGPQKTLALSKIMPSVVSIFGYDNLVDQPGLMKVSAGSGFFISSDGFILTNKHVVLDTAADYVVVLSNGKRRFAKVTYRDPNNDLALVKISGTNYPKVEIGSSSGVKIGQAILGIGNAYGKMADTVSTGSVSQLHRNLVAVDEDQGTQALENLIQTSAQLYPGDSGGPLFDTTGRVIGIDVAIAAERKNMSFAIPIDDAAELIRQAQ